MITTSNPSIALVKTGIDFHETIKATLELAEKYPIERMDYQMINDLEKAVKIMLDRMWENERHPNVKEMLNKTGFHVPDYTLCDRCDSEVYPPNLTLPKEEGLNGRMPTKL